MQRVVRLEFRRRPSASRYMARAFFPSPGLDRGRPFPDISARWSGYRAPIKDHEDFLRLSGAIASKRDYLPLLYPHAIGFRLQMAILTHPVFPVPIWYVLQIRNHLVQHRPIERDAVLDFETRVRAHRVVEKGLEVDLYTTVSSGGTSAWESLNTFYMRGRFGPPDAASPLSQAPAVPTETVAHWRMRGSERLRFASLTGDYNGLHLANGYARRLGYKAAFFHPQRVLGQCLAHLPALDESKAQRLDAWLKGPVYHDCDVRLCATIERGGATFALFSGEEQRPAMLGSIHSTPAPARLVDRHS